MPSARPMAEDFAMHAGTLCHRHCCSCYRLCPSPRRFLTGGRCVACGLSMAGVLLALCLLVVALFSGAREGGLQALTGRHHLHPERSQRRVAREEQVASNPKVSVGMTGEHATTASTLPAASTARTSTPDMKSQIMRLLKMFGLKKAPFGMKGATGPMPRLPDFMRDAFKHLDVHSKHLEKIALYYDRETTPSTPGKYQTFRFRVKLGVKKHDLHKLQIHRAELHVFRSSNFTRTEVHSGRTTFILEVKKSVGDREVWRRHSDGLPGSSFNLSYPLVRMNITDLVNSWKVSSPSHGIQFRLKLRHRADVPGFTFAKQGQGDSAQLFIVSSVAEVRTSGNEENDAERLNILKQQQRLEAIAAWDTLNKVTETWVYNYRPPNSLTNTSVRVVQQLPGADNVDTNAMTTATSSSDNNNNHTLSALLMSPSSSSSPPSPPSAKGKDGGGTSSSSSSSPGVTSDGLDTWAQGDVWAERRPGDAGARGRRGAGADPSARQPVRPAARTNLTLQQQSGKPCHLEPLTATVRELGWDEWVLAPKAFELGYCIGMCRWPLGHHNPSPHAVLQTLLSIRAPDLVPGASCVPTRVAGVKIMYVEDAHSVLITSFPQLRAEQCGCR